MFYIIIFGILAVLLIVAGITVLTRNRSRPSAQGTRRPTNDAARRQRKAQRAQSRHDRRKRH
jgi:hypothetical protein